MNEGEFAERVRSLASLPVAELAGAGKAAILRRFADLLERHDGAGPLPTVEAIPFVTGRRPSDEARHPGLGSSDCACLILDDDASAVNRAFVLYRVRHLEGMTEHERSELSLRVTLAFVDPVEERAAVVPGWRDRTVPFARFGASGLELEPVATPNESRGALAFAIDPRDLLPSPSGWQWEALDPWLRARSAGEPDPFDFGHLFLQTLRIELSLLRGPDVLSSQTISMDVCDARRFGSLYRRIVERVIAPDAARQGVGPEHHPWFPVLRIGAEKADLYMAALKKDIVGKAHNLSDPRWLLRVGLYLELLTCIGIFEAVRPQLGDLLSEAERAALEKGPLYAEIRERLDVEAWKKVWKLRTAARRTPGVPDAGPVAITNLLAKKAATLAFLHAHHEDLKHAIELARANPYNAQETWHRVFRDAERAVLKKSAEAFPELASLPDRVRELVLWYRPSPWLHAAARLLPPSLRELTAGQEGLYASACSQYRTSMNEVAAWARAKGLMEYTGDECVPLAVSLVQAAIAKDHRRLARLQRADGYRESLEMLPLPDGGELHAPDAVRRLLDHVSIFRCLTGDERARLAERARRIVLAPHERILIEGRDGASLFVVAEGDLEALRRGPDGREDCIAVFGPRTVIGEMSLLTGQPRGATVRALDGAVVYEIGRDDIRPLLDSRADLAEELGRLMAERMRASGGPDADPAGLSRRVRRFLLG